jgi:hypothetical protein
MSPRRKTEEMMGSRMNLETGLRMRRREGEGVQARRKLGRRSSLSSEKMREEGGQG